MADFPTFQDLFRISRDEALIRSNALTRQIVEREGTDANAMVAVGPNVGDAVVGQLIRVTAAIYLDTAAEEDLDRLVFDRYNIRRKPAAPGRGEVEFSTAVNNPAPFTIDADTKISTFDGRVFLVVLPVTFPSGTTGPISVPVISQLAGLTQHASIGTITNLTDNPIGAPTDLVVTNSLATFGAGDQETDAELRARARLFYTTAFRGTGKSLERGALGIPGIRTAKHFEGTDECLAPARWCELVIADQLTIELAKIDQTPPGYDEQSRQIVNEVRAVLENFRACGMLVVITLAVVRLIGITLSLRYRNGFDINLMGVLAKAQTVNYVNSLRPGDDFIIADLETALMTIPGLEILGGEVVIPATDLVATVTEVFRTEISLVLVQNCGVVAP